MTAADFFAGLPIPIIQAPMVGASSTAMTVAVSQAGGLGSVGAGAMSADEIAATAAAIRAQTAAAFAMNLFVNRPAHPSAEDLDGALARLAPWYAQVGAPLPAIPNVFAPDFTAQLAAVRQARPAVASFTFGPLTVDEAAALRAAGVLIIGTATTVAEAKAWADLGADAICAQGFEAGGHRGHFLAEAEASLVGTFALVATIRRAVDLPVIAAGGIMDGEGVAAALALGAVAAQMGTAFLRTAESVISAPWRQALEAAPDEATRLTRAITGRHARGIENRFMREMKAVEGDVPAYPVQNRLTQPLRAAAAAAGHADVLSLWAGQGATMAAPGRSGELVGQWWDQARAAAGRLGTRTRSGAA